MAWHIYLLMVLQDFPKNIDHLAAFWDKVRRYALLCRHFFILCCNINNLAERVICWQTVDYWPYITYLNEATCCFPLLASSVFMGLLTCPALPSAHGGPGPSDTVLGGRGYRGNDRRSASSEYTALSLCIGLCLGTSNVIHKKYIFRRPALYSFWHHCRHGCSQGTLHCRCHMPEPAMNSW